MNTNFIESTETFVISFGGKSSIDAETFSQTINNTVELLKESALANDPSCFVRLEIKANNTGSFETIIEAIVKFSENIFNKDNFRFAKEILDGYLDFIKIKEHLQGMKAKKIESNNLEIAIQNHHNEIKKFAKKTGEVYFKNCKIENIIVNQFTILDNDKRSNFTIKTADSEVNINKNSFENMKIKTLDGDSTNARTVKQKPIRVDLLVKKLDLLGDSKWQFIYNKNIEAKIDDEEFLEKVRTRKITILAGDKINCEMEVEYDLSERLEIIPKSERYNIKKISPEIIQPSQEDNQKSLFE